MENLKNIMKTIPNLLTVARLIGVFIAAGLMFSDELFKVLLALAIYIMVAVTDLLDGYLARKWDAVTVFGKIMDPIADKVYILTLYISFVMLHLLAHWWVWPIIVREVLVTTARFILLGQGRVVAAEKSGKIKTMAQNISVFMLYALFLGSRYWQWTELSLRILQYLIYGALGVAVFYTISSGIDFFVNNYRSSKRQRLQ